MLCASYCGLVYVYCTPRVRTPHETYTTTEPREKCVVTKTHEPRRRPCRAELRGSQAVAGVAAAHMDRVYLALDLLGQPLRREQEGVDVVLQLREARRADNDRSVRGHLVGDRGESLSWEQAGATSRGHRELPSGWGRAPACVGATGALGSHRAGGWGGLVQQGDGAFHQRGDEASRAAP